MEASFHPPVPAGPVHSPLPSGEPVEAEWWEVDAPAPAAHPPLPPPAPRLSPPPDRAAFGRACAAYARAADIGHGPGSPLTTL
ncbi:MAG TPA: hypothetical protein VEB20_16910 [Azospirillaceae bacterium]|nr:hypothetical protein [Azospirillaceae bacterium]